MDTAPSHIFEPGQARGFPVTEADAQELAWLREWRNRLLSAMRLWRRGQTWKECCRGWTLVRETLNEKPPTEGSEG